MQKEHLNDWRPKNIRTIEHCRKTLTLMDRDITYLRATLEKAEQDLYRIPLYSSKKRIVGAKLEFLEMQINSVHSHLNRLSRTTVSLKD